MIDLTIKISEISKNINKMAWGRYMRKNKNIHKKSYGSVGAAFCRPRLSEN
jgi:hypothetical protein